MVYLMTPTTTKGITMTKQVLLQDKKSNPVGIATLQDDGNTFVVKWVDGTTSTEDGLMDCHTAANAKGLSIQRNKPRSKPHPKPQTSFVDRVWA